MALIKIKQIDGLSTQVSNLESVDSELSTEIVSNDIDIESLESTDSELSDAIGNNATSIGNNATSIDTNVTSIDNNAASIENNANDIDSLQNSVGDLETVDSALSTGISTNDDAISTNANDIDSLQNSVTDLEEVDSELSTGISTNDVVISDISNEFIDSVQSIEEQFVPEPYTIDTFTFSDASVTELTNQRLSVGLTQNVEDESPGNVIYVTINGIVTPVGDVSGNSISTKSLGFGLDADDSIEVKYTAEHGS